MLYDRIIKQGTIDEKTGKPDPKYALPATINWMVALRIIVEDSIIDMNSAESFYINVNPRTMKNIEENSIYEQLLLSIHQLSALSQMKKIKINNSDFARIGIVAWYYGISNAASAMIAAQSGVFREDHAGTANHWDKDIVFQKLAMKPFDLRVSSLVKEKYEDEIKFLKNGSDHSIQIKPTNKDEAMGALIQYLSGSADYFKKDQEEKIKENSKFKELKVNDFIIKISKKFRDEWLDRKSISFLHQSIRYRGKANYREALYLAYGKNKQQEWNDFNEDLFFVLQGFIVMAGAFCKKKIGEKKWNEFVNDVEKERAFSLSPRKIWG